MRSHACYSRRGWWQTLCGLDAANQGFGWTSDTEKVGCDRCQKRIAEGEHLTRTGDQYMVPRKRELIMPTGYTSPSSAKNK